MRACASLYWAGPSVDHDDRALFVMNSLPLVSRREEAEDMLRTSISRIGAVSFSVHTHLLQTGKWKSANHKLQLTYSSQGPKSFAITSPFANSLTSADTSQNIQASTLQGMSFKKGVFVPDTKSKKKQGEAIAFTSRSWIHRNKVDRYFEERLEVFYKSQSSSK